MAESREPLVLQVPAEAIEREPSKGESESKATDLPKEPTGTFLVFQTKVRLRSLLLLVSFILFPKA
jgi:hypothetical protein